MQIDDTLLAKLERLGMLEISAEKKEQVKSQLNEILGFVENLNGVDVSSQGKQEDKKTPLREDEVVQSHIASDVLTHSPHAKDGFFIVPKIIE